MNFPLKPYKPPIQQLALSERFGRVPLWYFQLNLLPVAVWTICNNWNHYDPR